MNVIPSRPAMFAVIIAASATSSSPKLLTMLPLKEVIHHCVVLGAACDSYGSGNRAGVRPRCKCLICSWLRLSLGPCSRCQYNRHVGISCVLSVLFQVGAERVLPEHCFSLQHARNAHSTNTYGGWGEGGETERKGEGKGNIKSSQLRLRTLSNTVPLERRGMATRPRPTPNNTVSCSINLATPRDTRYQHAELPLFVLSGLISLREIHVRRPWHWK